MLINNYRGKLLECVKAKCKVIGVIMFVVVRLFGWYFWNKVKGNK